MRARLPKQNQGGAQNMNAMIRQAQKMQEDMKSKQAELEAAEYTGSAAREDERQARGAGHHHQARSCGPG